MSKRAQLEAQTLAPKPWEQQPDESTKAFAAFRIYSALGDKRRLPTVAERCGKSSSLIGRWSRTHAWNLRVRALDAHLERLKQGEAEKALKVEAADWAARAASIREREWQLAAALEKRALEILSMALTKATVSDAVRCAELASKLKRQACGMPTEHTEHTHSGAIAMSDCQVVIAIPANGRDVPVQPAMIT